MHPAFSLEKGLLLNYACCLVFLGSSYTKGILICKNHAFREHWAVISVANYFWKTLVSSKLSILRWKRSPKVKKLQISTCHFFQNAYSCVALNLWFQSFWLEHIIGIFVKIANFLSESFLICIKLSFEKSQFNPNTLSTSQLSTIVKNV